ncbi:hypothetical protein HMI55_003490, partial [Coelomomyces lativittatus]
MRNLAHKANEKVKIFLKEENRHAEEEIDEVNNNLVVNEEEGKNGGEYKYKHEDEDEDEDEDDEDEEVEDQGQEGEVVEEEQVKQEEEKEQ